MKKILIGVAALVSALAPADPKAVHGMLLVGTETVFASHLPMFHHPHDYQAIFEVTLSPEAKAAYLAHVKENPEFPYYTLVPQAFVLPEMAAAPKPVKANIVAGHFERPGHELVLQNAVITLKTVFFKKLDPKAAGDETEYFVFGGPAESFIAHLIKGQPSFDHVLQVETSALPGTVVTFPSESIEIVKDVYKEIDELS